MTRIVGHLTDLALAQEAVTWVEIRCDEANAASAAVPRRLGFDLAATIPSDRPQAPADTGRTSSGPGPPRSAGETGATSLRARAPVPFRHPPREAR